MEKKIFVTISLPKLLFPKITAKNFLQISDKVVLNDSRGAFSADKLRFDISNQTLNINSNENNKVNVNLNIKWKKVLEF